MKKGFFIDLDGTLLTDKGTISQSDLHYIKSLAKKHNVYLITGKSYHSIKNIYKQLELNTFLVSSMGQIILLPKDNHIISEDVLTFKDIEKIEDKMKQLTKIINFALEDQSGFFYFNNKVISRNLTDVIHHQHGKITKNQENMKAIIGSFFLIQENDEQKVLLIKKRLNQLFDKKYFFTYWYDPQHRFVIHARNFNSNKWKAISFIKKHDNLDYIVAIGNGWNDKEMLAKADIGIAMKNAEKNIQSLANIITKYDNNNSGVSHILEKINN